MRSPVPLILLLVAACAAPVAGPGPADDFVDDELSGKLDGYLFERGLEPVPVELGDTTLEATFDPSRYIAYQFEVDGPTRVKRRAYASWDNRFGRAVIYRTLLYRLDEEAASDDPNVRWSLVDAADTGTDAFGLTTPLVRYDVYQPGKFLVVVTGPRIAYRVGLKAYVDLVADSMPLEARDPGTVMLTLRHVAPYHLEGAEPAAHVDVTIGSVSGVTDETGLVTLDGVPAGGQLIKLGPSGNHQPIDASFRSVFTPVEIVGDGYTLVTEAFMRRETYLELSALNEPLPEGESAE